jgi:hypothetical protein
VFTKFLCAGICVALFTRSLDAPAQESSISGACQAHFTAEGSFLSGRKYSTWVELTHVARADAYTRIYSSVAKDGWSIVNADKDAGIISATQGVSYSHGSQTPMIITVETVENGSKVTLTYRTGGAQMVGESTVREKFCSYVIAASNI